MVSVFERKAMCLTWGTLAQERVKCFKTNKKNNPEWRDEWWTFGTEWVKEEVKRLYYSLLTVCEIFQEILGYSFSALYEILCQFCICWGFLVIFDGCPSKTFYSENRIKREFFKNY